MAPRRKLKALRRYPVDGLATIREAAEFLRVHRTTVYRMIEANRLRVISIGTSNGELRLPWKFLHKFAEGVPFTITEPLAAWILGELQRITDVISETAAPDRS